MASTIERKFSPIEKVRFIRMVVIIRRDSPIRCGSSFTSSSTSAMSAASTAMSLPTPPMAMPTSAFFSAGASLMPSPIMHTRMPSRCQPSMASSFSSGRQPARTSRMPSRAAMASAARSWSPVSSTGRTPAASSAAMVAALSARSVSESAR